MWQKGNDIHEIWSRRKLLWTQDYLFNIFWWHVAVPNRTFDTSTIYLMRSATTLHNVPVRNNVHCIMVVPTEWNVLSLRRDATALGLSQSYCPTFIGIVQNTTCLSKMPFGITLIQVFELIFCRFSGLLASVGWHQLSIAQIQRLHRWRVGMDK